MYGKPVRIAKLEPHHIHHNFSSCLSTDIRDSVCSGHVTSVKLVSTELRCRNVSIVKVGKTRFSEEATYVKFTCPLDDVMRDKINWLHGTLQGKLEFLNLKPLPTNNDCHFFMTWENGRFPSMYPPYDFAISETEQKINLDLDNVAMHLKKQIKFLFVPVYAKMLSRVSLLFHVQHIAIFTNTDDTPGFTFDTDVKDVPLTMLHLAVVRERRRREREIACLVSRGIDFEILPDDESITEGATVHEYDESKDNDPRNAE